MKNNINIINIINKFSEGNIKCLDLASGENNYVPDIFTEKIIAYINVQDLNNIEVMTKIDKTNMLLK